MSIDNHTFCWNGLVTTDPAATAAFFPEVVGWKAVEVQMGEDTVVTLLDGETPKAHLRAPQMAEEPSWWNAYLRVEDVDASAALVAANGGTVVVPPTDIVPGRFATVTTPSGAYFTLYREVDGAERPEGQGEVTWVELHSTDLAADRAFLSAIGVENKPSEMNMPGFDGYIMLSGGKAGAMAQANPGAPSMWLAWISVDDVDAALGRAEQHGGSVKAQPWEVPGLGRLAIAADPAGLVFGVMASARQG